MAAPRDNAKHGGLMRTRVRPGAGVSLLSTKTNSKKMERLLAREIYAHDVRGAPTIPVLGTGLCIAPGGMLIDHRELSGEFEPVFGMAGFASMNDVINALSAGAHREEAIFNKASMTTVAGNIYSRWQAGGFPAGGTFGTANTGRAMDNTALGALKFTSAAGGRWKHLLTFGIGSTIAIGTTFLYDRLAEYPFTGTTLGPQALTTVALPARDEAGATNGDGIMMFLESFSATATAAVTVTPTYTNSAGTGSRTNAFTSIATAALAGCIANPLGKLWLDLQSGDIGVRSISNYTLSASLLAANMCFVLARPLCVLPMLTANGYVERDLILQLAKMPRLYDGSCLSLLLLANATSCPMFGSFTMAEN